MGDDSVGTNACLVGMEDDRFGINVCLVGGIGGLVGGACGFGMNIDFSPSSPSPP